MIIYLYSCLYSFSLFLINFGAHHFTKHALDKVCTALCIARLIQQTPVRPYFPRSLCSVLGYWPHYSFLKLPLLPKYYSPGYTSLFSDCFFTICFSESLLNWLVRDSSLAHFSSTCTNSLIAFTQFHSLLYVNDV